MPLPSAAAGIKYKHVTYDGGNPAVIATVSGETEVSGRLSGFCLGRDGREAIAAAAFCRVYASLPPIPAISSVLAP